MATLQGMVWFISSSVSMIRPLKFFIKIISVSISWIMKRKRKRKIYVSQEVNNSIQSSYWETLSTDYFLGWLDCYELFSFCEQHLLCYENWILKFWSRWSVQKNRPALNLVFFLSDYLFLIFKDRLLNALFLFNRCAVECFQNAFFMALLIVFFHYSTAVSSSINQISSWNYII